jgi:hypothetical protein
VAVRDRLLHASAHAEAEAAAAQQQVRQEFEEPPVDDLG